MALSLWILSDKGVSASTQRLLEVASARGHGRDSGLGIVLMPASAAPARP